MPWIKEEKLYPIVVLLLILIMAVRTPLDTDMWWHLRAGEETWQNQEVYSVDTFSYTREGSEWINHSWLSQVVMYLIFNASSYQGLSIWVGVCAVISMFFIYLQMKGHPLLRSVVLIFAAVVSSVVWSPRPQIHSLLLFSLLTYLLFKYRDTGKSGFLIGSIPLFIVWGNLHGGYILGIIMIGSVLAGQIVDKALLVKNTPEISWKKIGVFALFMVAAFLVVLINPFGLDMWKIPFNTVGVETLQNLISEWASPDFHQAFQQPMLWLLLGVLTLLAFSTKTLSGTELVPLIVFSWLALTARRNFGPFAIVAAPIFAIYLDDLILVWLDTAKEKFPWINTLLQQTDKNNKDLNPSIKNLINSVILLLLVASVGYKIIDVNDKDFITQAERDIFPVDAVEWLKESHIAGNLFNDYNWGGYLIWHFRETPVFIDGRTDLYGDEILDDYLAIMAFEPGWEENSGEYQINSLLIQSGSGLARVLGLSGWNIAYQDSVSVLYHR